IIKKRKILRVQKDLVATTEVYEFCLVGCFLMASIIHFLAMKSTVANLRHTVKGV
ncbi:hypothetical protein J1N35_040920, partial [Gossypium stocksii]